MTFLAAGGQTVADAAGPVATGSATPLPGITPTAVITAAATDPAGRTTLVGTRPAGDSRRAFVISVTPGGTPSTPRSIGPAGALSTQPRVVAAAANRSAIVFAVAHTAYLTLCGASACSTAALGRSALFPQPAVAMTATGRTTALWRGRTRSRAARLQWRATTASRLGPVHSLGELGDQPQLVADSTGAVVAVWTRHVRAASDPQGLRTATRHAGAFSRPTTVQDGRVASPLLASGASGETLVAWQSDGQAWLARRTTTSAFAAATQIGSTGTAALALAASRDGRAVVVIEHQANPTTIEVQAATRSPHGAFGAVQTIGPQQFVSTAFPPAAAVDAAGRAVVTWAAGPLPTPPSPPSGLFATSSDTAGSFGTPAPTALSTDPSPPTLHAPAMTASLIAWVDHGGGHMARLTAGGRVAEP